MNPYRKIFVVHVLFAILAARALGTPLALDLTKAEEIPVSLDIPTPTTSHLTSNLSSAIPLLNLTTTSSATLTVSLQILSSEPTSSKSKQNNKNLQAKTPSVSTSISSSKRTDAPIHPSIFYRRGTVECATMEQLQERTDDPNDYLKFNDKPRGSRQRYHGSPISGGKEWDTISTRVRKWRATCKTCECDESTSRLRPGSMPRGVRTCHNWEVAQKCENWFYCYCVYEMQQPPRFREVTVDEYQDALNRIPGEIKEAHPDYVWKPSPGWAMRWATSNTGSGPSESGYEQRSHRELVPGTKEPYYLEGPGGGVRESWDSFGSSFLNDNFGPAFGKPLHVKRQAEESQGDPKTKT
ncbi:hypothetical protein TWF281_010022 [Arthrobotrys megalospora]